MEVAQNSLFLLVKIKGRGRAAEVETIRRAEGGSSFVVKAIGWTVIWFLALLQTSRVTFGKSLNPC